MADVIDFDGYAIVNTGGISYSVTQVMLPVYVIGSAESIVIISADNPGDPNAYTITLTLPSASDCEGQLLILKNKSPLVNIILGGPIDSLDQDQVVYLVSTGDDWEDITPSAGALL